jgi:hypothetical protein
VFDKRVLKRIFRPKRKEVAGGWRGLHNEKPHNLYASPNVIMVIKSRRMRWEGHVACMEKMKIHKILVGKLEGKRPCVKPRHRW